jgi:hypothetical protein
VIASPTFQLTLFPKGSSKTALSVMKNSPVSNLEIVFVLWIVIILGCAVPKDRSDYGSSSSPDERTSSSDTAYQSPPLEVLSWHWGREYSFLKVTGEVKNISSKPMKSVWAVVEFRAADGTLVKSSDGVVEYDPILPGQTSPFQVMDTDNPAITTANISFKEMFGARIPHKDSSPAQKPPPTRKK